jgi:hypothetical protein
MAGLVELQHDYHVRHDGRSVLKQTTLNQSQHSNVLFIHQLTCDVKQRSGIYYAEIITLVCPA